MPLKQCTSNGQRGWKWGDRGKCYTGPNGRSLALKQAKATKASVANNNPLRADPSRTATLRRKFIRDATRRLNELKKRIIELVDKEDAFGLREPKKLQKLLGNTNGNGSIYNQRFRFLSTPEQLSSFRIWLALQIADLFIGDNPTDDDWWNAYAEEGYSKGAGRAFDDTRKGVLASGRAVSDFYQGARDEFLRSAFGRPVAIRKLKILASRVFTELKGITELMAQGITRELVDGMSQGDNPRVIGRNMAKTVDISIKRATTIARTETIRAHAEGQLDALEELEVTEIGVVVEWSTARDERVCPKCRPLEGIVLSIKEARKVSIPRHPNCRCAFVPANVGEDTTSQIRTKRRIDEAVDQSVEAEIPKRSKRSVRTQRKRSPWTGAGATIGRRRPKGII